MGRPTATPRSEPVTSAQVLTALLRGLNWEEIRETALLPRHYNGFPCGALLAAHTLPYLLEIPSERALARELLERELLQTLCGFAGGERATIRGGGPGGASHAAVGRTGAGHPSAPWVPSRATLWHFRNQHPRRFGVAILLALATVARRALDLGAVAPFAWWASSLSLRGPDRSTTSPALVRLHHLGLSVWLWRATDGTDEHPLTKSAEPPISDGPRASEDLEATHLDAYPPPGSTTASGRELLDQLIGPPTQGTFAAQLVFPESDALFESRRPRSGRARRGLADDVALPAYAIIASRDESSASAPANPLENGRHGEPAGDCLLFMKPSWLYEDVRHKDRLGSLGPSYTHGPYTACNVLVVRRDAERDCVLLAQRLRGTGAGTYAAPGGKKFPTESVYECARRELAEETGLRLLAAEPVSLRHNSLKSGRQIVTSVGLIATRWDGEPAQTEPEELGPWEWYPLGALPTPIFGPTKDVLDDWLHASRRPTWSDVERTPAGLFDPEPADPDPRDSGSGERGG